MAGIYLHIPFCKQACTYCDFHFSTSLALKSRFLNALHSEIKLHSSFRRDHPLINTIYFGGGTPSILDPKELETILNILKKTFNISADAEITLEANPDDLEDSFLQGIAQIGINRLSIGVQSFHDSELQLIKRAHNSEEAIKSILKAKEYGIINISVDLIYGIPGSSIESWTYNVQQVLDMEVKHVSSYCLTVEPQTILNKQVKTGKVIIPEDDLSFDQFSTMIDLLKENGFDHYELSNFTKEGFTSKHNSAYWNQTPYLGLGPSAHSYDKGVRSFNIKNNMGYIKALEKLELPTAHSETLTPDDRFNEYLMTSLRTSKGTNLKKLDSIQNLDSLNEFYPQLDAFEKKGWLEKDDVGFKLNKEGFFVSDYIISSLFLS